VKDAHLVVISGDHARALPFHLRKWLEEWGADRHVEEAAVGVIDESADPALETEAYADLKQLLDQLGLNLITSHMYPIDQPAGISPTFSDERERRLPVRRLLPPRTELGLRPRNVISYATENS